MCITIFLISDELDVSRLCLSLLKEQFNVPLNYLQYYFIILSLYNNTID